MHSLFLLTSLFYGILNLNSILINLNNLFHFTGSGNHRYFMGYLFFLLCMICWMIYGCISCKFLQFMSFPIFQIPDVIRALNCCLSGPLHQTGGCTVPPVMPRMVSGSTWPRLPHAPPGSSGCSSTAFSTSCGWPCSSCVSSTRYSFSVDESRPSCLKCL